jgi:predicted TIM-barrel fold metal-dependent hydrolase
VAPTTDETIDTQRGTRTMKIIDSHCHAWERWPYSPPVPDPDQRGRVEQLLYEMGRHGVDEAVIVCAQIERNPANNAYVADAVARHPGRLHQLADIDSVWSPTYHQPGADARLKRAAAEWPIAGFTHYLGREEDGSRLHEAEGLALFRAAADLRLIASLSCYPHQQPAIRKLAERFPSLPILCHHLGMAKAGTDEGETGRKQVLASSRVANIYIKLSGFAYATHVSWDFPYHDTHDLIRAEYEHFGASRMCWGSDYPVVRSYMTYRQALEAFRTHCAFVTAEDRETILGGTLEELLARRQP